MNALSNERTDHAADLALAKACARREPQALEAFDKVLRASVAGAVARIDSSPSFIDVVTQELRSRLLLGDAPRIAEYAGRGPLAGWLRTTAARVALNLRRGTAERLRDDLSSGIRAAGAEPEIAMLRARHRVHFEEALRAALASLAPRDRAVLCLSVRDGMTCDDLAALYRVGRSTAQRWVAGARETLAAATRRELAARLGLSPSEIESIARAVMSEIDVSILRLLAAEG